MLILSAAFDTITWISCKFSWNESWNSCHSLYVVCFLSGGDTEEIHICYWQILQSFLSRFSAGSPFVLPLTCSLRDFMLSEVSCLKDFITSRCAPTSLRLTSFNQTHHQSRFQEDRHEDCSVLHPGCVMNSHWLEISWVTGFKWRLKTYFFTKHLNEWQFKKKKWLDLCIFYSCCTIYQALSSM